MIENVFYRDSVVRYIGIKVVNLDVYKENNISEDGIPEMWEVKSLDDIFYHIIRSWVGIVQEKPDKDCNRN